MKGAWAQTWVVEWIKMLLKAHLCASYAVASGLVLVTLWSYMRGSGADAEDVAGRFCFGLFMPLFIPVMATAMASDLARLPRLSLTLALFPPRWVAFWGGYAGFFIMALIWILRRRRSEVRMLRGLCIGCGYDLRASGERCPECGRPTGRGASRYIPIPPAGAGSEGPAEKGGREDAGGPE